MDLVKVIRLQTMHVPHIVRIYFGFDQSASALSKDNLNLRSLMLRMLRGAGLVQMHGVQPTHPIEDEVESLHELMGQ